MKELRSDLIDWAQALDQEIPRNISKWWVPTNDKNHIFDTNSMMFVNGNLNYYQMENMVASALYEQYDWNPDLPTTKAFCDFIKSEYHTPDHKFGRMVLWRVSAGCAILPHNDSQLYHKMVDRYILFITKHPSGWVEMRIDEFATGEETQHHQLQYNINTDQGCLMRFNPSRERHSFINNTEDDWIIIAFDVWNPGLLKMCDRLYDANIALRQPNRFTEYGTKAQYKYIDRPLHNAS